MNIKTIKMIYAYGYGLHEWMKKDDDMCYTEADFKNGARPEEVEEFFHNKVHKWRERLTTEEGCVSVETNEEDINAHLTVTTSLFYVNGNYHGYACLAISH